jgi:general secretion pathway protein M
MSAWWQQLDQRQQRLIIIAGLILLGLLLYVQVWEPLDQARQAQREQVAHNQALLGWLNALTPVAEQMRRQGSARRDLGGRSLLGLSDETARAAGLAGALTRIEPAGQNQVRVWLDGAEFLATMNWLQQLSLEYPVEVIQLNIDRGQGAGRVNVRVTLSSDA